MSSAKIAVPDLVKKGFELARDLSETAFSEMLEALEQVEPTLLTIDLANAITDKVNDISTDDLEEIFDLVSSFFAGSASLALDYKEFIDGIVNAEAEDSPKAEQSNLKSRLRRLMKSKTLMVTAKALNVMTDYPNVFAGARILTEIRPVFDQDASIAPPAAVIMHLLKIHFYTAGGREEFYVALDGDDLKRLKEVTIRALAKSETLKPIVKNANMTLMGEE